MLNATLVIQVLHFLGACICIHIFFLKKAVYIIQQEQYKHNRLLEGIDIYKTELAKLQEKNKYRWHSFVEEYQAHKPRIDYDRAVVSITKPTVEPEKKLDKETAGTIVQVLVKQVDYGN